MKIGEDDYHGHYYWKIESGENICTWNFWFKSWK